MKRLLAAVVVLALVLGFYVGWPALTASQISTAIKTRDAATLERKIDFPAVRATLKPAAELKIGEIYDRFQSQMGPGAGVIIAEIKKDVIPKIADTALQSLVTPVNLIRVVTDGGTIKENAEKILREQIEKVGLPGVPGQPGQPRQGGINLGAIGQIAGKMGIDTSKIPGFNPPPAAQQPAPVQAPMPPPPLQSSGNGEGQKFGLANIKKFSFLGLTAFEIGVAKDQAATEPDVITEMRFQGGDWRVTGVRPARL